MNRLILTIGLALASVLAHAETLTNCVRTGNTVNCTTQSREATNTPPSYRRLGSKEWCLVSNAPIKKYFCSYDSFDGCMVAANIDNLNGPISSCIKNSGYRSPSSQEASGGSGAGHDPVKAGWVALKNGDYQTAAQIFLANEHNPQAQMALGLMYGAGQGVPKNLEQARTWLLRAKRNGVKEADDGLKLVEGEISSASKSVGDACRIDSDCNHYRLGCSNGTCLDIGKTIGESCRTGLDCKPDAFCVLGQCSKRKLPLGSFCKNYMDCAGDSTLCVNNKCTE